MCFTALRSVYPDAYEAFLEIRRSFEHRLASGDRAAAMRSFLEFWAGPAAWTGLPDTAKPAVIGMAEKIVLEWQAAFAFDPGESALAHLGPRTTLIGGEVSPEPMRRLISVLHNAMPGSDYSQVRGANHLLPLTHADDLSQLLLVHLDADGERQLR